MVVEVDHRDAERADGGGGQVEYADTGVAQRLPMVGVRAGRRGVEDQADVGEVGHGEQSVDARPKTSRTPRRFARARPSEPGSMPIMAAISSGPSAA